jgi:hypothetical protein
VPELVRVSLTSEARRADLALPAMVPVAELAPELARLVAALGRHRAHAGFDVVSRTGRVLDAEASLGEQGVVDGEVLAIVPREPVATVRYDDPAEVVADAAAARVVPLSATAQRLLALTSAGLLLGAGLALLVLTGRVGRFDASTTTVVVPTALCLVALAGPTLPMLALAVAHEPGAADDLLLGLSAASGAVVVSLAPVAAGLGPAGLAVAVLCCALPMLGARRHRRGALVLTGVGTGVLGLVSAAIALLVTGSALGTVAGWVLVVAGLVAVAQHEVFGAFARRWGDAAGCAVCLALPSTLVVASGLVGGPRG